MSDKAKLPDLDCGDHSCLYSPVPNGERARRTNGGCRCHDNPSFRHFAHQRFVRHAELVAENEAYRLMLEEADSVRFGNVTFTREGGMFYLEAYRILKEQTK